VGKFWRVLKWKMLVYFKAIWSILQTFGIFCDHLEYFTAIWYIYPPFWYFALRKIWQPWHRKLGNERRWTQTWNCDGAADAARIQLVRAQNKRAELMSPWTNRVTQKNKKRFFLSGIKAIKKNISESSRTFFPYTASMEIKKKLNKLIKICGFVAINCSIKIRYVRK
jgi:hypothetical protein